MMCNDWTYRDGGFLYSQTVEQLEQAGLIAEIEEANKGLKAGRFLIVLSGGAPMPPRSGIAPTAHNVPFGVTKIRRQEVKVVSLLFSIDLVNNLLMVVADSLLREQKLRSHIQFKNGIPNVG